jgi:alkylation response protein AidB-like acyl-CoA dehydrogenase
MYHKVTAAKMLVMKQRKDEGKDITHSGAMWYNTSEIALEVANEAVQIHGGNGYVARYCSSDARWQDYSNMKELQKFKVNDFKEVYDLTYKY